MQRYSSAFRRAVFIAFSNFPRDFCAITRESASPANGIVNAGTARTNLMPTAPMKISHLRENDSSISRELTRMEVGADTRRERIRLDSRGSI